MPIVEIPIAEKGEQDIWMNYHKTGGSKLGARFALRSGEAQPGRKDLAENAAAVRTWLLDAKARGMKIRPVGGAWSPSDIQLAPDGGWMLNTRRFNRCMRLKRDDFADPDAVDATAYLLVEAGVQIDEINDQLEKMGRSLRSTGASNGQTIAGACATGTHGSVLDAGGIQDHVRAIQIVTPGGVHWIEPSKALMSDGFIAETGSQALRDDECFAAALVAIGSLGIVTAMVIETVPLFYLQAILKLIDFSEDDLQLLAKGDFRAFSRRHGDGVVEDPYFVMVVANPNKPFARKAVARFLYSRADITGCKCAETPAQLGAGYDAFSMLGWALHTLPWASGWIIQLLMKAAVGKGIGKDDNLVGPWGHTTETHKPLAKIFTGALFCDRADLPRLFAKACSTFTDAGGATAVTLRFMKGGRCGRDGLLTPARWADTAGVDFDGPDSLKTRGAFSSVMAALDREGVPFRRHWGKYNELTAARVADDYGDELRRWKAVRDRLLPPEDLQLFRTPILDGLGLTV